MSDRSLLVFAFVLGFVPLAARETSTHDPCESTTIQEVIDIRENGDEAIALQNSTDSQAGINNNANFSKSKLTVKNSYSAIRMPAVGYGYFSGAPTIGRLNLSHDYEFGSVYGTETASSGTGSLIPVIAIDPDGVGNGGSVTKHFAKTNGQSGRSTMFLRLVDPASSGTSTNGSSGTSHSLGEIFVGFDIFPDPIGQSSYAVPFQFYKLAGPRSMFPLIVGLYQDTSNIMALVGGIWRPASTSLSIRGWQRIKFHYKAATQAANDGILELWLDGFSILNVTNHNEQASAETLMQQLSVWLTTASYDHECYYRRLEWGTSSADVADTLGVWKARGLQFGQITTDPNNDTNCSVRLRFALDPTHVGTPAGGMGVTWQYKLSSEPTVWITDGVAGTGIFTDSGGEYITHRTIQGLTPLVSYDFRVLVDNSGGTATWAFTSNTCTTTLPSSDGGSAGNMTVIIGGCSQQGYSSTGSDPWDGLIYAKTLNPTYFIHMGDMAYADFSSGIMPAAIDESTLRNQLRASIHSHVEMDALLTSCGFDYTPDDHEWDVADPTNPFHGGPIATATFLTAIKAMAGARRINTLGADPSLGTWRTTARCLFLNIDCQANVVDAGASPNTLNKYFGDNQLAAIQTVLQQIKKPLIIISLTIPIGTLAVGSNNESVDFRTEWQAERTTLVNYIRDTNPNSMVIFCASETHQARVWAWTEGTHSFTQYSAGPFAGAARNQQLSTGTLLYGGGSLNAGIWSGPSWGSGQFTAPIGSFTDDSHHSMMMVLRIDEPNLMVTTEIHDGNLDAQNRILFSNTESYTATLKTDLIAYYKLEEMSGIRKDASVSGFDFIPNNSPGHTAGIISSGLLLNGNSQDIRTSSTTIRSALQPQAGAIEGINKDYSIQYWAKPSLIVDGGVISNHSSTAGYQISMITGGSTRVLFNNQILNASDTGPLTPYYAPGVMRHYVYNFINGVGIELWVNGVFQELIPLTTRMIPSTAPVVYIGNNGNGTQFFPGILDEIGFWGRALFNYEITQLYNHGIGFPFSQFDPACAGDIAPSNGNGVVNIDDLVAVLNAFGFCGSGTCVADIAPVGTPAGNGIVNIDDLVAVLNGFGGCP